MYDNRYHRASGILIPVCSTGLFAVQVILGRYRLYDRTYPEYCSRTYILRWIFDLFLFGILQGNAKTSWIRIIPVGIIYFFLYYFIFTFLIKKFNLKTPGREDDDAETKLYTKADVNAKEAGNDGAGEKAGSEDSVECRQSQEDLVERKISDVDCCATRLRCTVSSRIW